MTDPPKEKSTKIWLRLTPSELEQNKKYSKTNSEAEHALRQRLSYLEDFLGSQIDATNKDAECEYRIMKESDKSLWCIFGRFARHRKIISLSECVVCKCREYEIDDKKLDSKFDKIINSFMPKAPRISPEERKIIFENLLSKGQKEFQANIKPTCPMSHQDVNLAICQRCLPYSLWKTCEPRLKVTVKE